MGFVLTPRKWILVLKVGEISALFTLVIAMDCVLDLFGADKKKFTVAADKWDEIIRHICILDGKPEQDNFADIVGFPMSILDNHVNVGYFMVVDGFESASWYNEEVFKGQVQYVGLILTHIVC
jgi:hypothetical protein